MCRLVLIGGWQECSSASLSFERMDLCCSDLRPRSDGLSTCFQARASEGREDNCSSSSWLNEPMLSNWPCFLFRGHHCWTFLSVAPPPVRRFACTYARNWALALVLRPMQIQSLRSSWTGGASRLDTTRMPCQRRGRRTWTASRKEHKGLGFEIGKGFGMSGQGIALCLPSAT